MKTDEINKKLRGLGSDPVVRDAFKGLADLEKKKSERFRKDYAKAIESGFIQTKKEKNL